MNKTTITSLTIAFLLSLVAVSALAQSQTTHVPGPGFADKALNRLSLRVARIGDDVRGLCRGDLTSLASTNSHLARLHEADTILAEIRKTQRPGEAFPTAKARRLSLRIATLEDSLVRLQAAKESPDSTRFRTRKDARGTLIFEAVQGVCTPETADGTFDDVCKALDGTPSQDCGDCFFGLFTCCENICTPN